MDDASRRRKEKAFWDRLAPSYDGSAEKYYHDTYRRSIGLALAAVTPTDRVLEIGCGTGIITMGVAARVAHIEAIDISPEMISVARGKAEADSRDNVTFRVSDGYSLPFDVGSFDVVLAFNVLHLVDKPKQLLGEAHRLLKPGGLLASATDCYAEPMPFAVHLRELPMRLMHLFGVIPNLSSFRKRDIERMFAAAGYVVRATEELFPAPLNYYVLAQRV